MLRLIETHRAQVVTSPHDSTPEASPVGSITGFMRGTLVRIAQDDIQALKVVSDVDAVNPRLVWVHPKPERRLLYDAPLAGFNPNRPCLIESIEYTLLVFQARA